VNDFADAKSFLRRRIDCSILEHRKFKRYIARESLESQDTHPPLYFGRKTWVSGMASSEWHPLRSTSVERHGCPEWHSGMALKDMGVRNGTEWHPEWHYRIGNWKKTVFKRVDFVQFFYRTQ